jgi:hypothetical protein
MNARGRRSEEHHIQLYHRKSDWTGLWARAKGGGNEDDVEGRV